MSKKSGTKPTLREKFRAALPGRPGLYVFVADESFSIYWHGCTLYYLSGGRYSVESGLRAAILATDRAVRWEP